MNNPIIFIIASASPVLIFLYLIFKKDKQQEPISLLLKCFIGGFVAAGLALVIEFLLGIGGRSIEGDFSKSFYTAFIIAAGTEEVVKWLIVRKLIWNSKDFDQHYDGIIYAVFVSLGFALIENLMYVFDGGIHVAIMRAVLAVPGHGFFAVIMGYFLSLARFEENKTKYLLLSLGMPILFHGLYDFCLMYLGALGDKNPVLSLGLVVLFTFVVIRLWIVGFKHIKLHVQKDNR
jgi:RsiW-degrading membrane proteinase PrsW (M82 family)